MEEQFYKMVIEKRAKRIPLQHITGEQEFMGLTFRVNENTLIPRQDTEVLVEEALRELSDGMRILDVCTGSGCILLSLMKYSNECEGIGLDISAKALEVAKENARLLNVQNVDFVESDLFEALENEKVNVGKDRFFDIIISNPPYIESAVIETLMPEVKDHEPMLALDGKEDGLFFYRKIVDKAPEYIRKGGKLLFEIGYNQGEAVRQLMLDKGFTKVEVIKDFAGLDRVVCGNI
ncbi:MAG: peptide chain release factor N(5)-glutamine methyltransferase [Lachnospiraceae bacterium]|nr:peptide chain release factor N(5)-glutamine methyltransferase [Lachnospiraceae bacterium]